MGICEVCPIKQIWVSSSEPHIRLLYDPNEVGARSKAIKQCAYDEERNFKENG